MTDHRMTRPIADIANGLTEAQRRALVRHPADHYYGAAHGGWPESAHDPTSFCKAGRALMDNHLIAWHPDRRDSRTRLTPLGKQVRAHLEKNP